MPVEHLPKCNICMYCIIFYFFFWCFYHYFSLSVLCAHACRRLHWPVFSATALHVHHIIRQESIFNISEHHNPRAGHRGRLREEDLAVTWLSTREGQAARDWGTQSQTQRRTSQWDRRRERGGKKTQHALIWSGTHVSLGEHVTMQTHANKCAQPALHRGRKWYLTGMMIPLLGWWNRVIVNAWYKKTTQKTVLLGANNKRANTQSNHFRGRSTMNFTETL